MLKLLFNLVPLLNTFLQWSSGSSASLSSFGPTTPNPRGYLLWQQAPIWANDQYFDSTSLTYNPELLFMFLWQLSILEFLWELHAKEASAPYVTNLHVTKSQPSTASNELTSTPDTDINHVFYWNITTTSMCSAKARPTNYPNTNPMSILFS